MEDDLDITWKDKLWMYPFFVPIFILAIVGYGIATIIEKTKKPKKSDFMGS